MSSFYQMETHLTTNANPISPMHPANKRYVDGKVTNVDGARFVSGTIDVDKLPGMVGDVTSAVGSNVLTLNNSGVVPGVFNSVTVDGKGRVINGTFTPQNTSDLSWTIVQNKPTTLGGYGISDVVSLSAGDTVASMNMSATQSEDQKAAVTKGSIDALMSELDLSVVKTGEVVRYPTTLTPGGFLRANGGMLSKATYSALYAIIGDAFNNENTDGFMGQPWRQQQWFNNTQTTNITGWLYGTDFPNTIGLAQAVVTKNRVYMLGGYNGNSYIAAVYTASINEDGTLGPWSAETSIPTALGSSQAIITKNRVYLLGGVNGGGYSNVSYTAPINEDGTIGSWSTASNLPGALGSSQAVVTKNRVYLLGGRNNSGVVGVIYTNTINSDGTLNNWTTASTLPRATSHAGFIVTQTRIYMCGGYIAGGYTNGVYSTPINADGTLGEWVVETALPAVRGGTQAVVTKSRAYLFGGLNDTSAIASVQTAPINADGTLGGWTTGTSIPNSRAQAQVFITSGRIYLLGGSNINYSPHVYFTTFSGGTNDYLALVTNNIPTANTFKLPDYTSKESDGLYHYIKY